MYVFAWKGNALPDFIREFIGGNNNRWVLKSEDGEAGSFGGTDARRAEKSMNLKCGKAGRFCERK